MGDGRIVLHEVDEVERALGVTIPDPILAYVAAGVSVFGDGPVRLRPMIERTLTQRENGLRNVVVFDDDSNGNWIVFKRTSRDSDAIAIVEGYCHVTRRANRGVPRDRRGRASLHAPGSTRPLPRRVPLAMQHTLNSVAALCWQKLRTSYE
jgi:hypothetical protein